MDEQKGRGRMKPILFNTDMVKAILDGRKTVTRRVVRLPPGISPYRVELAPETLDDLSEWDFLYGQQIKGGLADCFYRACAPYKLGDILYVRETWADIPETAPGNIHFKADATEADLKWFREEGWRWRPSIHMPKGIARLFLRVTDVRAEMLQSIKTDECVDEGAVMKPHYTKRGDLCLHSRYKTEFSTLWDSTVKKSDLNRYGWEANPWVWVIVFERCKKPEEGGTT